MATQLKDMMEDLEIGTCRLARKTGINHAQISCYRGGSARPNYKTAQRIAAALGVKISDLWPEPLNGQPEAE